MCVAGHGAEPGGDTDVPGQASRIDGEVAQTGQNTGCGPGPDPGGVFAAGDIADPLQPVLDAPVPANIVVDAGGMRVVAGQAGDA